MSKEPLFVAVSNQKGGVGKSALTVVLASYFHFEKNLNVAIIDCDSPQHSLSLIHIYARKKGYWQETKSSESTFPLVKDNLVKGIVNACRLRSESELKTREPIYNRNPYTNVYILVGRLIGKVTIAYGDAFSYKERGCNWSVTLNEDGLTITNHKYGFEHFGKGLFVVYDWKTKSKKELNVDTFLLQDVYKRQVLSCLLAVMSVTIPLAVFICLATSRKGSGIIEMCIRDRPAVAVADIGISIPK